MTNEEASNLIKEIGLIRRVNKIKLHSYDSWFLYSISLRIYKAKVLSDNQKKYLLIIYKKVNK